MDLDQKLKPLLSGCEAKQNEGLELLFCNYKKRIFSFFYKEGLTEADCEDLTQETFMIVCGRVKSGRYEVREAQVFTWLYSIAVNLFRNKIRRLRREESLDQPADLDSGQPKDPPIDVGSDPLAELDLEEKTKCLREFVDSLSPEERLIAQLYFYEDLGPKAIWEYLGKSEGSVRGVLQRVRGKLKVVIEQHNKVKGEGHDKL